MLILLKLAAAGWAVEYVIGWHNDFMKKYRQAQEEGRL